jgi:hypothetical protein
MRLTRLAIATAPALFVLLWSTGFIGARYGMPLRRAFDFSGRGDGFRRGHHGCDRARRGCNGARTWPSGACSPRSVKGYRPAFPR